ncbi:aspartate dehydrogenase domain-containing protein [Nocardia camponoti]|uniref:L-aspartate dehydrogenase n=1 Tax=Nocardia camponoti TaxID=1616106 RepID=A0A917Q7R1_9NOCA|nr:aspartate dehydrogenase domain-containing protein [Nocardia camponoti]GGK33805.1 putative L-aspartate dehydrogenase [Nocardia camponoti]
MRATIHGSGGIAASRTADGRIPARVCVLGYGSIGTVVADRLSRGAVPGAELVGIVHRSRVGDLLAPSLSLAEALEIADVVVECASQEAVWEVGQRVVDAGCDLLVSSVGALSDPDFAQRIAGGGPGRVVCTHGAVGGLDLLAAARDAAPFDHVLVRSTKSPASLVQSWMDAPQRERISSTAARLCVFAGSPAEAARLFPKSLNVAAAVSFAVRDWDTVSVELYADPDAEMTCHEIEASGPIGRYSIKIENLPSAANPRSSAVVPYSILRTLAHLTSYPNLIA